MRDVTAAVPATVPVRSFAEWTRLYLDNRGLVLAFDAPDDPAYVVGEAEELRDALVDRAAHRTPHTEAHAKHELADVILSTAILAESNGWTVEECLLAKIELDRDRDRVDGAA